MQNSVYLVSGEGLPPKLAVVALDLELDVLLSIENRFVRGPQYTTVTPVDGGVFALAAPHFGPHDQAYFPGYDNASTITEGGDDFVPADAEPGRIVQSEVAPEGSRRAYLVARAVEDNVEMTVAVLAYSDGLTADAIVQALAMKPGAATITAQYIGSGSFLLKPEIAQFGFRACLGPAVVL
jgi:hypothetical protein